VRLRIVNLPVAGSHEPRLKCPVQLAEPEIPLQDRAFFGCSLDSDRSGQPVVRDPARLFAAPAVRLIHREDGTLLLSSPEPLRSHPRALGCHLIKWAERAPDRPFLLERDSKGQWSGISYKQALDDVVRLGGGLLARRISPHSPIAILSENSVEHGLLMLAAMHVGLVAMPISAAYSLSSSGFGKLKSIISRTQPALIYVDDCVRFGPALAAIRELHTATIVVGGSANQNLPPGAVRLRQLYRENVEDLVARAFESIGLDTVAKILFTSGSTDEPKGVINTQGMLCSNQQAKAQVWPFLESSPPVLVDWLPWNHTFGGNHNFNLILRNGGTLYIDAGRPIPSRFDTTLENLNSIPPTVYFNVPRGFELLIDALHSDTRLCERFFSRLQLIFYAAASLPINAWDALSDLCVRTTGEPIPLVSAWGSTETAPLATDCYFGTPQPGVIGLPVPGCELKLLPVDGRMEVRVRGPNVFPGYWQRADLTQRHFDSEGFYLIGDAVRFVDHNRPELGLVFDGRIAEDFKLSTGTWVSVSNLRLRAITALAPLAQDVVIAGHDRGEVGFLIFPNLSACRTLCSHLKAHATPSEFFCDSLVRAHIARALQNLRDQFPASSMHGARAVLLEQPPDIDAGEITDKGYINQRAVLATRKSSVDALYADGHPSLIIPLD
jgi:feruloyl-CoA synthase